MEEEKTNKPDDSREIDLSALSALDFNPEWASADAKKISLEKVHGDSDRRGPRRGFKRDSDSSLRDRRFKNSSKEGSAPEGGSKPFSRDRRHNRRDSRFAQSAPLPRVADVAIYPEDKRFAVLAKAMKNSSRTYVLFDIARIVLEKPERFMVVVTPPQKKDKESKEENPPAPFYVSTPDGMPFLNESDAIAHVFKNHADKFFSAEDTEVEPPKGNFTMIAKCGFTGELLAPPNYHAYQQILRDHHAAHFPRMPFERFQSKIETVKEPEQINAWLEKMKKVTRYVVKDRAEGEPEFLESESAAKNFLATNRKEQAVKEVRQARFSGSLLEPMPMGPLRSAIVHEIMYQRKFPLKTANNLRGKLRYLGFTLYKKGANGVSLVCGVKRKFRTPESVFSETIQRIFDFLDKNPGTPLIELPAKMFGIEPKAKSDAPAKETKEAPVATETATEAAPEAPKEETALTPIEETPTRTSAEESQVKELFGTMRWLVNEGYVTEMSDGKLYAQPVLTVAQAKAKPEHEEEKEEKLPNIIPEENPTETPSTTEEPEKPAEESAKENL